MLPNQTLLAFPKGRGGKRKGAGRKAKNGRAGVRHQTREKVTRHTPVFVTMKVAQGLPSLRSTEVHSLVARAFREVYRRKLFRVIEYSIQHDHLHLVVETHSSEQLSRGMSRLSIRIARRLNKLWQRTGRLWRERFHSRAISTPAQMRNVLRYCLNNGRKHGAWLNKREPDVFSSGKWFTGWGDYRNSPRDAACPVAPPSSWLASIGWRKNGLLPVASSPAA